MLRRWFHKKKESDSPVSSSALTGAKVTRHSKGWAALRKRFEEESGLHVLDVGGTSPANINFLTGLGHSIFLADIVHDACAENWQAGLDEMGDPVWDVEGFLAKSLDFSGRKFDVVLLWAALDYLPEPMVAPVVQRFFEAMQPGGQVLAFFHTRTQGEETAYCRFLVTAGDEVEVQLAERLPIQRAFTNRRIEQLFAPWSGFRQFLAKDGLTELIITR